MDEMFGLSAALWLTVVIDKGMNSEDDFTWIDDHARIHFITTYFAQDLAATPLNRFEIVDTVKNKKLIKSGYREDCLSAYRTKGEYWGKERAVIVTYNPRNARKKFYTFESKLETIRQELLVMRAKFKKNAPHWRDEDKIKERYLSLCEKISTNWIVNKQCLGKMSSSQTIRTGRQARLSKRASIAGR